MSRLDLVALAKQSALGTKQTTMEYVVPVEGATPAPNRDELSKEETTGTKFPTDVEHGSRFYDVGFHGACRPASMPRILSGFMGPPTTTTPGGGVTSRKHSFDPYGKTLVPHSIDVARKDPSPVVNDLFWDALGNELKLSVATDDYLNFDASYIAKELDQAQAAPAGSYDLGRRFAFHTVQAFINVNGAGEVALPCGGFELTYSNNLKTDLKQLGSRSLYKIPEGNVDGDVTFTPLSTLDVHYRRALQDADPDNVKIRLLATGPIIEGAIAYQLEIIVYRCQYLTGPLDVTPGDTTASIQIGARAALDVAASKFVDVNVTNNVTTY